jgi:predicted phosphodiesterase
MRIAALSDIHGNLGALNAVLEDIEQRDVDQIVNLGDILSGGLAPCETADRLMPLGLPTIAGNHERQVLYDDPASMSLSDRHALNTLRADQRHWIASLPESLRLSDEVLLVHGIPNSDLVYYLETIADQGTRAATLSEVRERTGNTDARLILRGHSHVPRVVQLAEGRWVVNPGSVGLRAYVSDYPLSHLIEMGTPHARYAIVERRGASWLAELLAVPYDWHQASLQAEANGRSDWARALRTGRVQIV